MTNEKLHVLHEPTLCVNIVNTDVTTMYMFCVPPMCVPAPPGACLPVRGSLFWGFMSTKKLGRCEIGVCARALRVEQQLQQRVWCMCHHRRRRAWCTCDRLHYYSEGDDTAARARARCRRAAAAANSGPIGTIGLL